VVKKDVVVKVVKKEEVVVVAMREENSLMGLLPGTSLSTSRFSLY
jgi:hypothetical protein